ncbi:MULTISPECIES: 2OG-Fe(II) oxygenase [unclassified Bradyrhizobium]|uniref:2OG-Fe(II) oxygenase n=1 Tax=unclassified Bradyrhizobium TaxID=2631580 RepID=UPI0028E75EAE|nr:MULTISPECIES: 2OG-Fe(II) oxygenase [unclassified Bradyrhizobium]
MTELTWHADDIETIASFLSAEECDDYIRWGEAIGFGDAPISTSMGMIIAKDVRNNERVMVDDAERAQSLYARLAGHLAPSFQHRWQPVGLNERLRLYRYDVGQKFDWHRDGHFARDNGERSLFTFLIYLNDDFEGGATSFCDDTGLMPEGPLRITPQQGMALLFHHPIMHRGDRVTRGRKYVLRTDVMYRRAR